MQVLKLLFFLFILIFLDLYEVERIVGKKVSPEGITLYRVKWKGYDSSKNTWEPIEHFAQAKEILNEFEKTFKATSTIKKNKPNKPGRKKHVRIQLRKVLKAPKTKKDESDDEAQENDDVPQSIVSCISPHEKDAEKRMFKISWKKRNNGITPRGSVLSAAEIKHKLGTQILLQFYEKNFA